MTSPVENKYDSALCSEPPPEIAYERFLISQLRAKLAESDDNPFYLIDLEILAKRYFEWIEQFPNVVPFYAVKCNPNTAMLHTLERLGCGFDCASREEMNAVLDMGVDPSRVIFANPCKLPSHIAHARFLNVRRMTFDNADELEKVAKIYPEAEMVLRIATDDSASMCKFSSKFGAYMVSVPSLLQRAKDLNVRLVGVSFHVGSGCGDPRAFAKAADDALTIFKMAEDYGFNMNLLDIGGGFQGEDGATPLLSDIARHLNPVLRQFPPGTQFMAEPGRYFAAKSHTICVNIHSRRVVRDPVTDKISGVLYYVNDGVYHSFNCIFFDHQHPVPRPLTAIYDEDFAERPVYPSTVFGPTCDSLDCICKDHPIPLLEVGDWMYFTNMGAYTTAALTHFNGFTGAITHHYMWGEQFMEAVISEIDANISALNVPVPEAASPAAFDGADSDGSVEVDSNPFLVDATGC